MQRPARSDIAAGVQLMRGFDRRDDHDLVVGKHAELYRFLRHFRKLPQYRSGPCEDLLSFVQRPTQVPKRVDPSDRPGDRGPDEQGRTIEACAGDYAQCSSANRSRRASADNDHSGSWSENAVRRSRALRTEETSYARPRVFDLPFSDPELSCVRLSFIRTSLVYRHRIRCQDMFSIAERERN